MRLVNYSLIPSQGRFVKFIRDAAKKAQLNKEGTDIVSTLSCQLHNKHFFFFSLGVVPSV